MAPVRRSGRERKVNARYSIDAFEGLDLSAGSADEGKPYEDSEDEFEIDQEAEAEAAGEDDDVSVEEESDTIVSADEDLSESDLVVDASSKKRQSKPAPFTPGRAFNITKIRSRTVARAQQTAEGASGAKNEIHSRGLLEIVTKSGKHERRDYTFGAHEEDWQPVLTAMDKWLGDTVLPSRNANKHHVGGFSYSWFYTEELRAQELANAWQWYHRNGGKKKISSKQVFFELDVEEGETYLPEPPSLETRVLMGPKGQQRVEELEFTKSLSIDEVWKSILSPEQSNDAPAKSSKWPEGWLLNVGGRVQNLQWIPHQSGTKQYLCVSVLQTETPEAKQRPTPAFVASPPFRASLQIWSFEGLDASSNAAKPDYACTPRLEIVLCSEWGGIKQHEWCPVLGKDNDREENQGSSSLGLLAVVSGDGKLRVLDVQIPDSGKSGKPTTRYINVSQTSIELSVPDTLCTSLCWLSSCTVAAGCANGYVAAWSLPEVLSASSRSPRPFFYHSLHQSYILDIASGYPSRPYFIATTSMDGFLRLTDVRSPLLDTVLSTRHRVGSWTVSWNDQLQSFVAPDETFCARLYGVRKFYTTVILGKFHEGNMTSIALSPVHPIVLMGSIDGEVASVNPLRRINDPKSPAFQQTWFLHEWRRPLKDIAHINTLTPTPRGEDPEYTNHVRRSEFEHSLVRIMDSFEAYHAPLENSNPVDAPEGSSIQTIFEPETGITALAWNPNMQYGGWAAAGMGSGLVRVEDIAVGDV